LAILLNLKVCKGRENIRKIGNKMMPAREVPVSVQI